MYFKGLGFVLLIWTTFQIRTSRAQCGGRRSLYYDQSLQVSNAEYPGFYYPQTQCLWEIESPADTQFSVSCSDISMPSVDHLYFFTTGRKSETLRDKSGVNMVHEVWPSNRLSIEIPYTYGSGRYSCFIQVLRSTAPPTQPPVTNPPTQPPTTTSQPTYCDCGWRYQRRIVGGVETGINEYPFMVGIVSNYTNSIECGGVIISRHYVLTAAHCNNPYFQEMMVLVGAHNINQIGMTPYAKIYRTRAMMNHPGYNPQTYENDISIIETREPIAFSMAVGPVCLPFNFNQQDGYFDVTALGWGTIEYSGPKSDYLQKVTLRTVTNDECRRQMTELPIKNSQICVYANGMDTCSSDSGGPLVYFDPYAQRFKLIGLVSYGRWCGSTSPSVNTRVKSFEDFIQYYTGLNNGEGYCVV